MLRRPIPIAIFFASTLLHVADAHAESVWQGSYSVDEQCFCSGEISSSLAALIVPTPIGGQTVSQVCRALGQGPELTVINGVFNYPVFKDPQCGHGPFSTSSAPRDKDCVGRTDGTYASCLSAGPRWNLAKAYGMPVVAAANSQNFDADISVLATTSSSGTSSSRPVATLAESAEDTSHDKKVDNATAQRTEQSDFVLADFTGRVVVLGDERYLQAKQGVPAVGGATGSRIIVDGLLFLRQDSSLNTADLFQEAAPIKAAAAKPVERTEPVVKAIEVAESKAPEKAVESVAHESAPAVIAAADPVRDSKYYLEAMKQARLKKQRADREEQALAEYLAEQKVRSARLAEKENLVDEPTLVEDTKLTESDAAEKKLWENKTWAERQLARNKQWAEKQLADKKSADERLANRRLVDKKLAVTQHNDQKLKNKKLAENRVVVRPKTSAVKENPESNAPVLRSALPIPDDRHAGSRNFSYIEAMPAGYDVGGGGVVLEGSIQSSARFQYLGRVGIADSYREVMVGGGIFITPASLSRMTFVLLAGVEFGSFELRNEQRAPGVTITSADNGLYLGAMSRFVINSKFELKSGVGYSTFFEGDATFFGGAYYHVTQRLDVMSRFELGDNDQLGVGIRYYY